MMKAFLSVLFSASVSGQEKLGQESGALLQTMRLAGDDCDSAVAKVTEDLQGQVHEKQLLVENCKKEKNSVGI